MGLTIDIYLESRETSCILVKYSSYPCFNDIFLSAYRLLHGSLSTTNLVS